MCGRYGLTTPEEELVEVFGVPEVPVLAQPLPRYNIAPTQVVPAVVLGRDPAGRRMGPLRWGLVPWWADDPSVGNRMINARMESAHTRPAYRDAFARHRCLIPADGFYEWQRPEGRGPKRPFWIHREDRRPFAFAGLWDRWRPKGAAPDAEPLVTFTILTGPAPDWLASIHDRMPVVLEEDAWDRWMSRDTSVEQARALLQDARREGFEATEVSSRVNKPEHDDSGCMDPVES